MMIQRIAYTTSLLRAHLALDYRLGHYAPMLGAVFTRLGTGLDPRVKNWPAAFEKAGIRSILELGCGADASFLKFLGQKLPQQIDLVGMDLSIRDPGAGRLQLVRGEAAELSTLLPGKKFDLIISNGMFSHRPLCSEKYDLRANGPHIIRAVAGTLSDHPRAAAIFSAFSIDLLLLTRQEFEAFGKVIFWKQLGNCKDFGQTVVFTGKK